VSEVRDQESLRNEEILAFSINDWFESWALKHPDLSPETRMSCYAAFVDGFIKGSRFGAEQATERMIDKLLPLTKPQPPNEDREHVVKGVR
jgi:hypothetical protein